MCDRQSPEFEFRDARLTQLFDYWLSKRQGKAPPRRADVRPGEIRPYLPIVHLIDVHREPLRFRHRLVGTELVERTGRNVTGQWVDESLYGPATKDVFEGLKRVTEELRPYRTLANMNYLGNSSLQMEAMELPLVDDEGRASMLLRGASFFYSTEIPAGGRTNGPISLD